MLGDRRSNSLFAAAPSAAQAEAKPEQAEVHDISFEVSSDAITGILTFLRKVFNNPVRRPGGGQAEAGRGA